ncbi:hypothetical protein HQ325_16975 [Rhodococcus sp. BP-349]|uniref:hypothetical protein n=1 Tax=unclassified Rhodococcus (in: high G+C Gram-positive bacteria) TaxID=192944 RepID=UPI001C9A8888|nr:MULTISPECIES: hypothetical protein [unclassified Rhodococcus (in: high G+C Gram-positive bacteria)]MBY6540370.1 hypothetical protein [Rhodococcus sp. BP-363]MBY6545605.1 hypothetical protein [Rhodococcus sp. BP-369]MBY6564835.1 hypothetical protein [Rhodococcus sp. BP-370]MBY6578229.1 hypothetical protein [Rhodococcus sp. BP-364]MBY6587530.1 hypothetical protein [Rhodococcus sp. BP-358]
MPEPDVSTFPNGPIAALSGLAAVAGLIIVVSVAVGFDGGLPTAIIMFAGAVGVVSSGIMERVSTRRDRRVGATALVANAVVTSVGVYVLVSAGAGALMT